MMKGIIAIKTLIFKLVGLIYLLHHHFTRFYNIVFIMKGRLLDLLTLEEKKRVYQESKK